MPLFLPSTPHDIPSIFALYDDAMAFQKTVFHKQWEGFDLDLIQQEVSEGRQWKIMEGEAIACIFALTFNDRILWGAADETPSIYLHRIVTNSKFRGQHYVPQIIEWAKGYGQRLGKTYLRLDTWGDNPRLIQYYVQCGFHHLRTIDLDQADGLPKHYKGVLALFEMPITSRED